MRNIMIRSFADKRTGDIFSGKPVKTGFPSDLVVAARCKLDMLDSVSTLESLKCPPSNKLHPLKGDRKGQHAIWINAQRRLCFVWLDGDAHDVEITDYHQERTMSIPREKIQMQRLPTTPGEMLLKEFLEPNEMSARALARDLGVPPNRITSIINGKRAITAETAVLLEQRLGMPGEFWMKLQSSYDLALARLRQSEAA